MTPTPCVPCCTTPQSVNIPGIQGPAGADGAPGADGPQGPPGTIPDPKVGYGSGSAYALTITAALLNLGTTQPSVTLTDAGTYLLFSRVRLDYTGATFAAARTVTLKLRCVNNTIADVPNAITDFVTDVTTTETRTMATIPLPVVAYVATAGDVIQAWGSVSVAPTAGSLDAVEAEIVAVKIA